MCTRIFLICLAVVGPIASQAISQTLVRESFDYPATLDKLGSATNGFGGPWAVDTSDHGVDGLATIGGNVLFRYADMNRVVPYTGNCLQVTRVSAWSDHNRFKRPLATTWANTAGKHYWVSYLLDVKDSLKGNAYLMLKLYYNNGEIMAIGKGGGRDNNAPVFTCGSGWPGSSGDDVSATQISLSPVWLVVRIDPSGSSAPARTFMWVDPDPTKDPDTTKAIVKRNSTMTDGFNMIAVEFGGDGGAQLVFDEIRIGNTFAELSASTAPVRESFDYPATLDKLGSATNGFGGPWAVDTSDHGVDGLATIGGNVLFRYADLNRVVPYTGNCLQVTRVSAWSDHNRFKRPLATTWANTAGKHYWVSYLLDVKDSLKGNAYLMLKLYYNNGEIMAIGKGGGRDNNAPVFTCGSGWPGSSGDDVSATQISLSPVWLVVRIDPSGSSAPARTFMWVDPDPTKDPDTTKAIVKRNSTMTDGFNMIAIEFGGDGGARLVFDEIRIASAFKDLSTVTSVHQVSNNLPVDFTLSQNYPNPFNPTTLINYSLPQSSNVTLKVFNLLGVEVATLVSGMQNAGDYRVTFVGSKLSSGVYFYRLQAGSVSIMKKMMLLR